MISTFFLVHINIFNFSIMNTYLVLSLDLLSSQRIFVKYRKVEMIFKESKPHYLNPNAANISVSLLPVLFLCKTLFIKKKRREKKHKQNQKKLNTYRIFGNLLVSLSTGS